jgi:hypothetical protein
MVCWIWWLDFEAELAIDMAVGTSDRLLIDSGDPNDTVEERAELDWRVAAYSAAAETLSTDRPISRFSLMTRR